MLRAARATEMPSLAVVDAQLQQGLRISVGLHALSDYRRAAAVAELHQ